MQNIHSHLDNHRKITLGLDKDTQMFRAVWYLFKRL